jgi:hypothetical protein
MNQFIANTGAMNGWQQKLGDISTDVGNFISGAPGTSTVTNTHGTIGFPMQTAFDAAQSARGSAMGATQAASAKIGDLLRQAAQAYERGDMAAASDLKAKADQMDGSSSASAAGGSQAAQAGGASSAGQMLGQMGQLAGQMAQSVTQPLAGMAQALGQMPQQVFQGVQGIVQTATQGAAGMGSGAAEAAASAAGAGATGATEAASAGAAPAGAGGPEGGEKAPVGVMSEERMRELQGEREPMQQMDEGGDPRPNINPINL